MENIHSQNNKELTRLAEKIIQLRWQKEHEKALYCYKTEISGVFDKTLITLQTNLIAAICDCLRETGQIKAAIDYVTGYLQLNPNDLHVSKPFIVNQMWLFYFALKPEQTTIDQIQPQQHKYIVGLIKKLIEFDDVKLRNLLFFRYCDFLQNKTPPYWNEILELAFHIQFKNLSAQPELLVKKENDVEIKIELASPREKWFMLVIKALYANNEYEKCISYCKEAFDAGILKFHYGNQIWISRYLARCYVQSGKINEAIHGFERILKRKNDWFLQKELADLYKQKGQMNQAEEMAANACLNGGHSQFKVALYELMAQIYEAKLQTKQANDWRQLAVAVRKEQNWSLPANLKMFEDSYNQNISSKQQYQLLMKDVTYGQHEKKLTFKQPLHDNGTITRILHFGENGDGFITSQDGKSVYFRFSQCKIEVDLIKEGTEVSFKAIENEHKGKKIWKALKVYVKK